MTGRQSSIIILMLFLLGGALLGRMFLRNDFDLPQGGQASKKTVLIENGQVVDTLSDDSQKIVATQEVKEIMITDGIKHSVPLAEIIGGGPPKDGIPSIDDPRFINVSEAAQWLEDDAPGIVFSRGRIKRFYPYQILVWHEIVNDTVAGKRILVSYCPLCLSGIVFDPLVKGDRVEFGTSGKLWNSNLVMYDRKTDSLWSQILGEAIVGEMTGTRLNILPSDIAKFGDWKNLNPDGEVLSRATGARRFYGQDPYGDYYSTPGVIFPVNARDDRLAEKDFVLGIVINDQAKAYWTEAIKKAGEVEDVFQGKTIIARYEKDLDFVRLFERQTDGTLKRINPFPNFWFSWAAAHPDTELYK